MFGTSQLSRGIFLTSSLIQQLIPRMQQNFNTAAKLPTLQQHEK